MRAFGLMWYIINPKTHCIMQFQFQKFLFPDFQSLCQTIDSASLQGVIIIADSLEL